MKAVQNAIMLIRLSQDRKERDAKALRDALSEVSGTDDTSLNWSGPSGRDTAPKPEIHGLNSKKDSQQRLVGDRFAEGFSRTGQRGYASAYYGKASFNGISRNLFRYFSFTFFRSKVRLSARILLFFFDPTMRQIHGMFLRSSTGSCHTII